MRLHSARRAVCLPGQMQDAHRAGWRRVAIGISVAGLFGVAAAALLVHHGSAARATLWTLAILAAACAVAGIVLDARATGAAARDEARRLRDLDLELETLEETVASREAMLAAMQEGIVLFAPDGSVAFANAASRDLLGRRFSDASEVAPIGLRDAVKRVQAGEGRAERVFETAGRSIEAVVVETEPHGSVLVVARDITTAKRTEQLRRDFVANASHELKTPVASILALASALQQASGDPSALDRFLDLLEREADRLSRLVSDLLDLSRLESETVELRPVRLDRILLEESEKVGTSARNASLRLVVEQPGETLVMGRESDLGLMVHNLLDNAIRYTQPGGEVRLSLLREDHEAVIRVDDTGIGIPGADLERVFERFYRVDAARSRETGGTGLGLSIVRHVAESHHGEVGVRSVLGAGTTFSVRLPVTLNDSHP